MRQEGALLGAAIVFIVALVVGWIERRSEPPIMRKRVNAGSDRFLSQRGSIVDEAKRKAGFARPDEDE